MGNKPISRSWNDMQIVIATISMALTLGLWNLFAGPDRETALKRTQQPAQAQPTQPTGPFPAPIIGQPTPLGDTVLLLGGNAPQTTVIVQSGGGNGSRNNNASGGGTGGS